ncbi:hypothetical protein PoB_003788500 [Plakobranchus ocellatus]|uniref:Uncharacterized protein n=1 Tax=Plakobranchus ocellatus TaxID=259542 RepID=A0AAV4ASU4_9GAST|nr:hypothetical protein PoB_003788500 [Plakobranchus ocellatus]
MMDFIERQKRKYAGHIEKRQIPDGQKEQEKLATTTDKGQEADSQEDGGTMLGDIEDRSGSERLKSESNGGLKPRATSFSGWTAL